MYLLTAANSQQLLTLLYVLFIHDLQDRDSKPDAETAALIEQLAVPVVKEWSVAFPSLRKTLIAVLKNRNVDDALQQLGYEIKVMMPEAKKDRSLNRDSFDVLNSLGAFFRNGSESAVTRLKQMASITKDSYVIHRLAPKAKEQDSTRLAKMVKALTGRLDTALTMEESKAVKAKNPEKYKEYLELRREFNQTWKDAMISYIRNSGKNLVEYPEVLNYLESHGYKHSLASGFTGLMDDKGFLYTSKEHKRIDGIPSAGTFPTVKMNQNYGKPDGGDWVFVALRSNGEPGAYFYTSDFRKARAAKKFAIVDDLGKRIENMRKKWLVQVRTFDEESIKCVAATIIEILYEFSARIGSVGNAAGGSSTYGVGTILVKHVHIQGSNITIKYSGKDGVPATHKLNSSDRIQKMVIANLLQLIEGKEPKDRVFTVLKNGKPRPITGSLVNAYFKSIGAGDATVHKLRTVAGTTLFNELIEPIVAKYSNKPITEKLALDLFKKAATVVGKKLNHVRRGVNGTSVTGTTALNAYIDTSSQIAYFMALDIRLPKYLEKFAK